MLELANGRVFWQPPLRSSPASQVFRYPPGICAFITR
jgi:hypothetical protein